MFNRREKIGFQVFIKQHFLPLIEESVDNEIDSLYAEINKNEPPIAISKEQTKFELTILFLKTSGYGLSQIKGIDERFYGQLSLLTDEHLNTNFADIELNTKWLSGRGNRLVFSEQYYYYSNKLKIYKEFEQAHTEDKISKRDFPVV
jgi:hypothetical protein